MRPDYLNGARLLSFGVFIALLIKINPNAGGVIVGYLPSKTLPQSGVLYLSIGILAGEYLGVIDFLLVSYATHHFPRLKSRNTGPLHLLTFQPQAQAINLLLSGRRSTGLGRL
ncbi:unnamed protein product [Rhizoctonia solani]|uniref:Uncharacterized protein n=1 Tax=Rhizoctonia solani TaxID=456999 RepID=A0A8H3GMP3_9AGAM|nr:unnamed protein product [Rhizoctonia solani]